MKNKRQKNEGFNCAYPNCDNCNNTFEVPNCMLVDSGIDFNESVIVIPYKSY